MKGLFITGTDTNVGKTYIACQIASELHSRGINVTPRKPIETGCELINKSLHPSDANLLLKASNSNTSLDDVCPYRFSPAISPQLAAQQSNQIVRISDLVSACTNNIEKESFLIVEGAGGFYSPICQNALNSDLARELDLPVLIVVENRLGSINQALLTIKAVENNNLKISSVILNSTSPIKQNSLINNLSELQGFTNHMVIHVPFNKPIDAQYYQQLFKFQ